MKIIVPFLLIFLSSLPHHLFAQNDYKQSIIISGDEKYHSQNIKNSKVYFVYSVNNKLDKVKQQSPRPREESMPDLINWQPMRVKVINILKGVIDPQDMQTLKNSRTGIGIMYYISDEGKVLELRFYIDASSSAFHLKYLSSIEKRIKKEVVFTFSNQKQLKGANYLSFTQYYFFSSADFN